MRYPRFISSLRSRPASPDQNGERPIGHAPSSPRHAGAEVSLPRTGFGASGRCSGVKRRARSSKPSRKIAVWRLKYLTYKSDEICHWSVESGFSLSTRRLTQSAHLLETDSRLPLNVRARPQSGISFYSSGPIRIRTGSRNVAWRWIRKALSAREGILETGVMRWKRAAIVSSRSATYAQARSSGWLRPSAKAPRSRPRFMLTSRRPPVTLSRRR